MTQEQIKKIDWTTHCLKSIYHESKDKEFYIKVFNVGEYEPTGFINAKQLCFDCRCYEGQGYKTERSYLRCCLIGSLYEIVEIPRKFKESKIIQMSIFDFIGD